MNKEAILGLVRHLLTFAGGALAAQGYASEGDVAELTGALATAIGVTWSIIAKRQAARPAQAATASAGGNGAGALLLLLAPLSCLFWMVGCTTVPQGQSWLTPARVEAVTRLAAYGTAKALLIRKPESSADLAMAQADLDDLIAAERWDIATAALILEQNGLTLLSSEEGNLAITGAVLFIDIALGRNLDLKDEPYAKAFLVGARDGLTLAFTSRRSGDQRAALINAARATR